MWEDMRGVNKMVGSYSRGVSNQRVAEDDKSSSEHTRPPIWTRTDLRTVDRIGFLMCFDTHQSFSSSK